MSSRRAQREAGRSAPEGAVKPSWPMAAALVVLLSLIPFRTVINETHTFEVARLFRSMQSAGGAQPGTTLAVSAVIFSVAAFVLWDALRRGRRLFRTGGEIGAALLLVAAVVCTIRAGQKHLALIGVIDFLAMVVYFLTLRQLLRRAWQVRLALLVVVGTGAAVGFKCLWQKYYEIPETIAYFEKNRAELSPGDPRDPSRTSGFSHDFEMRLRSGAMTGFYAHPNPLASQIILFVMAAIALIVERRRNGAPVGSLIVPAIVTIPLGVALVGTQSQGAVGAMGIAIALWVMTIVFRRVIAARPRGVVIGCWVLAIVGCAAVVGLLRERPEALGRSMLFRFMYWRGAAEMVADRGVLGVGANNFGRHFTRYKAVECPEEVESPHSWPMQFLTEWGIVGLAGFLIMAGGVSLRAAGNRLATVAERGESDDRGAELASDRSRSTILWIAAVFTAAFVPWVIVLGATDVVLVALHIGVAALPWFVGMAAVSLQSLKTPAISDAGMAVVVAAIGAGLVGFLVHTSIDLALFAGGPATTFFALGAILLAARETRGMVGEKAPPEDDIAVAPRPRAAVAAALGGAVVVGALVVVMARPSAMLAEELAIGRTASQPGPWDIYNASAPGVAYRAGHAGYELDATAGIELTEQLVRRVQTVAHCDAALAVAEETRRRDPDNALIYTHLSVLHRQRYELTRDLAEFREAIEIYRRCVAEYPTAPLRRIQLANLLEEYGMAAKDRVALERAAVELEKALELESKRIYVSQPNRMRAEDVVAIRGRLEGLRGRVGASGLTD